jgi:exodeoxyribonuclease-3
VPFTIATWNINSVRLRIDLVTRVLREQAPDVLCLQETKCPNEQFPLAELRKAGYLHAAFAGQKGYNGVAILSRHAFTSSDSRSLTGRGDARHIAATLGPEAGAAEGLTIENYYVPAGGDVPDRDVNLKFGHKLDVLEEMALWAAEGRETRRRSVLVGDLNIAPYESDVWSHKALLDVVSHTPVETEGLERARLAGGFVDAMRTLVPQPAPLYTWWSYRSPDWEASNRGRRLDHVWVTEDLGPSISAMTVLKEARSWEKPSDHVPVLVTLAL